MSKCRNALYGVLIVVPAVVLVWMVLCCSVDVPFVDDYAAIFGYLNRPFPERMLHLADFHNEHRLLVSRIIFELIYRTCGEFSFTACMLVGAAFMYVLALLIGCLFARNRNAGGWLFLPFLYLIASFINYDNICWAMASVSNIPVHVFVLMALFLFERRGNVVCFVASILSASIAMFTQGCGMAVWGAFVVMFIHERLRRNGHPIAFSRWRCIVLSGMCLCMTALYFTGFTTVAKYESFSFFKSMRFLVSYIGGVIPLWSASLAVGTVIIAVCLWLLVRILNIRNTPALAFMAYLLACVVVAALMRGHNPESSLICRYRIIPVCLLATLAVLVHEQLHLKESFVRLCSYVGLVLVIAYVTAFTKIARPTLLERNEELRLGMLSFVDTGDVDGLWYQSTKIDGATALRKMMESRMYNPQNLKCPGEHPPYKYDKGRVYKDE